MDAKEIIKNIRKLEIRTKGLSKSIFSGEYHSAFKGVGMSFSEVRPYKFGDEVKHIDWNVTARTDEPHIKIFEEDRELNVILLIDISKSAFFGTTGKFKKDLATEITALIAFSAIANNDKVGAILFSDQVEKYIPPKKGKKHTLRIIRESLYFQPKGPGTDIGLALKHLNNVFKKRSIVFLISDFISPDFLKPLQIANKKHDLVAIRVFDDFEVKLPDVNILRTVDAETGQEIIVDTSSAAFRNEYERTRLNEAEKIKKMLLANKIELLDIGVNDDYTFKLYHFFKKRAG
jgi:uncharacterized protein (DUF58 family)